MNAVSMNLKRADYEEFLFAEAALLDEWRLDEWLALFTEDAIYEVPTAGSNEDADSAVSLFYIADDYARLCHRVKRLMKPGAHSESPRSHTARIIANVRILQNHCDKVEVGCRFVTYRTKNGVTDTFFGHHRYVFTTRDSQVRIASKRTFIDAENLRPQGRVSIIL